ncbi:hypothetical protein, partial [Streptomyces sp. NRRL F-2664]|uniref:hypothetical protein n=1 Tax=Streptomyces sp. NRRL F-2664 TaxID=1463842 RepID=UPI0018FE0B50
LYHPETGRFTTRDPHPTPLNKYQAFTANPIEHIDPTGNLQLKIRKRIREGVADSERRLVIERQIHSLTGRPGVNLIANGRTAPDEPTRVISSAENPTEAEPGKAQSGEVGVRAASEKEAARKAEDRRALLTQLDALSKPVWDSHEFIRFANFAIQMDSEIYSELHFHAYRAVDYLNDALYGHLESIEEPLGEFSKHLSALTRKFSDHRISNPNDPIYVHGSPETDFLAALHGVDKSWVTLTLRGKTDPSPYRLRL